MILSISILIIFKTLVPYTWIVKREHHIKVGSKLEVRDIKIKKVGK